MTTLLLTLLMAALIYLCRLSGFMLPSGTSSFWTQGLRFIPLSIFTALVISALYKDSHVLNYKVIALLVAGVVMLRTRQFGLSVLTGLSLLWLLMRLSL